MKSVSRKIIGKNIKNLRLLLGLSQYNFATLVELSKATIVNIESAKKGYNLDLIDKISDFTGYSMSQLSNDTFKANIQIRENLIEKYRNKSSYRVLVTTPEIVYAVKYKLLESDFFKSPKEIKEIREFFKTFGWLYKGPSISNVMKRRQKDILITPHPLKLNTKRYQIKI
jgi:transcriptional regulator with XRE-family HTH domain